MSSGTGEGRSEGLLSEGYRGDRGPRGGTLWHEEHDSGEPIPHPRRVIVRRAHPATRVSEGHARELGPRLRDTRSSSVSEMACGNPRNGMNPFATMSRTSANPEQARHDVMLMERVALGDEFALSQLYDRFAGLLLSLSRRILGDQEEAEDVVQDVFVQVWNQAKRYDSARAAVSTWLSLIVRSRSIDRLRSLQVKDRTAKAAHEENSEFDASPVGDTNVLEDERRVRLNRELEALPAEQRQVLELAFFEGMTQSEISETHDIPLGTVKTRTLLAMKKLRMALSEDKEDLL